MANDIEQDIFLPEVERKEGQEFDGEVLEEDQQTFLHLFTYKNADNGTIVSSASVYFVGPDGFKTFMPFSDYRKVLSRTPRFPRITAKMIQEQFSKVFTPEVVEGLKKEVKSFYDARRG